jgi:DNA-binding HxlR family transcriptional regulator
MYQKKIKEDLDCGIIVAMKVLCAKWKPCIIDATHRGCNRPSEIHQQIPGAAPRVLDIQLSELFKWAFWIKKWEKGFQFFTPGLHRGLLVHEIAKA